MGSSQRVFDLLDMDHSQEERLPTSETKKDLVGKIEFRNVNFL